MMIESLYRMCVLLRCLSSGVSAVVTRRKDVVIQRCVLEKQYENGMKNKGFCAAKMRDKRHESGAVVPYLSGYILQKLMVQFLNLKTRKTNERQSVGSASLIMKVLSKRAYRFSMRALGIWSEGSS